MRIVRDFKNQEDALAFSAKLRRNGIPTHTGVFKGNNSTFYGGGPVTYGVWVLLDRQHSDALKLRKGNRHQVENPLSKDQMNELEADLSKRSMRIIVRDLAIFLVLFISMVAFIVFMWQKNV